MFAGVNQLLNLVVEFRRSESRRDCRKQNLCKNLPQKHLLKTYFNRLTIVYISEKCIRINASHEKIIAGIRKEITQHN